jgi:hypothetical protein
VIQGNLSENGRCKGQSGFPGPNPRDGGRTLDRLEEVSRSLQARIGAVTCLRVEAHGCTIASTRTRLLIVRSTGVPSEAQEHRAVAAVVVIVLLFQAACNLLVHLLVVLPRGLEHLGGLRRRDGTALLGVVPEARTTGSNRRAGQPEERGGRGGLGRLGGVEATAILAEGLARGRDSVRARARAEGHTSELSGCRCRVHLPGGSQIIRDQIWAGRAAMMLGLWSALRSQFEKKLTLD